TCRGEAEAELGADRRQRSRDREQDHAQVEAREPNQSELDDGPPQVASDRRDSESVAERRSARLTSLRNASGRRSSAAASSAVRSPITWSERGRLTFSCSRQISSAAARRVALSGAFGSSSALCSRSSSHAAGLSSGVLHLVYLIRR